MNESDTRVLFRLHDELLQSLQRLRGRDYLSAAHLIISNLWSLERTTNPGFAYELIDPTIEILKGAAQGTDVRAAASSLLPQWYEVERGRPLSLNYLEGACRSLIIDVSENTIGNSAEEVADAIWEYDRTHPEDEPGRQLRTYISSLA